MQNMDKLHSLRAIAVGMILDIVDLMQTDREPKVKDGNTLVKILEGLETMWKDTNLDTNTEAFIMAGWRKRGRQEKYFLQKDQDAGIKSFGQTIGKLSFYKTKENAAAGLYIFFVAMGDANAEWALEIALGGQGYLSLLAFSVAAFEALEAQDSLNFDGQVLMEIAKTFSADGNDENVGDTKGRNPYLRKMDNDQKWKNEISTIENYRTWKTFSNCNPQVAHPKVLKFVMAQFVEFEQFKTMLKNEAIVKDVYRKEWENATNFNEDPYKPWKHE